MNFIVEWTCTEVRKKKEKKICHMHKLCESPPQPAVAPKSTQREKNDFVNAKMEGQNAKKVPFAIAMPPQPPLPWLFFCHYHFGNYWSHPLAPSPPQKRKTQCPFGLSKNSIVTSAPRSS